MALLKIHTDNEVISELKILDSRPLQYYIDHPEHINGDIFLNVQFSKMVDEVQVFENPKDIKKDLELYTPVFGLTNPVHINPDRIHRVKMFHLAQILHKTYYEEERDIFISVIFNDQEIDIYELTNIQYQFLVLDDMISEIIYISIKKIEEDK